MKEILCEAFKGRMGSTGSTHITTEVLLVREEGSNRGARSRYECSQSTMIELCWYRRGLVTGNKPAPMSELNDDESYGKISTNLTNTFPTDWAPHLKTTQRRLSASRVDRVRRRDPCVGSFIKFSEPVYRSMWITLRVSCFREGGCREMEMGGGGGVKLPHGALSCVHTVAYFRQRFYWEPVLSSLGWTPLCFNPNTVAPVQVTPHFWGKRRDLSTGMG